MPEKRPTYRINETMLRSTLLGYTVEVNAAECSAIEQEASSIRMQKAFVMPEMKTIIKFVVIPLLLITTGILVYSNIDSIRSAFTPTPQPALKVENLPAGKAGKIVSSSPVVKTQTVAVINIVPPPVVNNIIAKSDTVIVAENKVNDSAKKQNIKQAGPVIADPPTDSATLKKNENSIKTNKVDTASQKTNEPVKKKKKKRRKRSDAYIEDVKESSLQPNSADDDVVVPQ